ncbi:CHAT domain-containing protein [Adonisia turfae]|uniref:CHAT domain-containing protein n=1 Tax=Adonisia turfae CCMR0081 TaxID=2292702 RepID=A0A6M0RWD9_9CYAN|nr:CHAT domain-containing protein [Adonisia turfae]NEZ60002.1 CHAT domain-containing protein [Adonisia turfae CCMR0081]
MLRKRLIGFKFLSLCLVTLSLTLTLAWVEAPTLRITNKVQAAITAPDNTLNQDLQHLVQQGRDYYRDGQWEEALTIWQQAEQAFADQEDTLSRSMVLSNLALAYQQLDQLPNAQRSIDISLDLLNNYSPQASANKQRILAQVLNTQGHIHLAKGEARQALDTWQRANKLYTELKEESGIVQSAINLAQAQRTLGFYSRSHKTLEETKEYLDSQPDSLIKALSLYSLGNTLRPMGLLADSQISLKDSLLIQLKLLSQVNNPQDFVIGSCRQQSDGLPRSISIKETIVSSLTNSDISATILSLANTARLQGCRLEAQKLYGQAVMTAVTDAERINARIDAIGFSIELGSSNVLKNASQLATQINELPLPNNRSELYTRLHFAQTVIKLIKDDPSLTNSIAPILVQVREQAYLLKDKRSNSYALGYLGKLYELQQRWPEALSLTHKALELSNQLNALEISYRWEWQLGRIYKAQGNTTDSISAYQASVNSLSAIRQDLAIISSDEFSFEENIEPVYRELASLLLKTPQTKASSKNQPLFNNLDQARNVIESLQTAELDDFFRQACLEVKTVNTNDVDPNTALVYAIVLDGQINVITSVPNQPLHFHTTSLSSGELDQLLKETEEKLNRNPSNDSVERQITDRKQLLERSQHLYDWIIRDSERYLKDSDVTTLTFVLDGPLRNIPMAILHDGQKYLIEKYSVVLSPGLQLLNPKPLPRQEIKALTAGISEKIGKYQALPGVRLELDAIKAVIPNIQELFNSGFTKTALQKKLDKNHFPIVHLATHGQFGSKAEDTFLLAWQEDASDDGRISIDELQEVLQIRDFTGQEAIELLVLSACQTADGDDRAALGIAGVALRAGARSTVATLWPVSDRATAIFMKQFYQEFTDTELTKAEALQRAQRFLLEIADGSDDFSHPYYWAPYTLIGNWL